MFLSTSSVISVVFLCSLLIIFISFIAIRLIFPFEFTFSSSFASRYIMPCILSILNTPVTSAFNKTVTIFHIVLFIWGVGIVITATVTIKTHLYFGHVVKKLPRLHDSKVNKILHKVTQDYKRPVSFQVIHSNLISSPMLYGFRYPKIIVPTVDLTYKEWYFVLKHEITHYYNRDLQIKMFVQILQVVYWWNPFIYLLNAEIDKMLEIRTDLEVTKAFSEYEKTKYLDCLLKIAKNLSLKKNNYFLVTFDNGKTSVLSQRFHLILGGHKRSNNTRLVTILMVAQLVLLMYFSFIAVFEPYSISTDHAANTVELTEDTSYLILKWRV